MKISLFGDLWSIPNTNVELEQTLTNADLTIFNLETPLVKSNKPINKIGPVLKGDLFSFQKIMKQFSGLIYASLANNHIMDHEKQGALDTIECCKNLQVLSSGVGEGLDLFSTIIKKQENKIAIISICEKQFQSAQMQKFGTKCFSPEIYNKIQQLKNENCFIIISYHQGVEYLRWPCPEYQDIMRSLIDVGADIIHGHHSHVPQGYEKYKHGLIFYGLGNFIVPTDIWQKRDSRWSIGAEIVLENNSIKSYKIIPSQIVESKPDLIKISPYSDSYIESYLKSCNQPLNDRILLESIWQEFSMDIYENRFKYSLAHKIGKITHREKYKKALNHFFDFIQGKEKYLKLNFLAQYKDLIYYHYSSCEAHRYAIETALGVKCGEIKDLRSDFSKKLFA